MVDDIFSRPQAASRQSESLPRTTSITHRKRNISRSTTEGVFRANPTISRPEDSFVSPKPLQSPSRLSNFTRPHFSSRRQKRRVEVPEPLRDPKTKNIAWEIETYEADDGSVEVVDCAFIASRKDLRRWRLSLNDFHALVTGGTEAIEAYRAEQRRQDEERKTAVQHEHDVQDILDADEALAEQLLAQHPIEHAEAVIQPESPEVAPTGAAPQASAQPLGEATFEEPLWLTIVAWPYRAIKRFWLFFLELVGARTAQDPKHKSKPSG